MELDYKEIGKRVKIARIRADLTQEALAEKAGLSITHMSNIENGHSKLSLPMAVALANAFDCGANDLPLSMVLSWYEQKAVCILLTLLYLGIKNIYLGPSLPAFVSPNVLNFLVENYNISPISTPEEDLKKILG